MAENPPPYQATPYPPPGQPAPSYDQSKQMPPQQAYPPTGTYPQTALHTTTIIAQPTTAVAVIGFGEAPVAMVCPFCQAQITTGTTYENGDKVWLWMVIFCFFGGLLCFWIPLVIDSLKDVHHHCPNCKRLVGTFRR